MLTSDDWEWAAAYVAERLMFGEVEGVPAGGYEFANHLAEYKTPGCGLLIVDDVMTTGNSMNKHRGDREAKGFVLFARTYAAVSGDDHEGWYARSPRRADLTVAPWVNAIWKQGGGS